MTGEEIFVMTMAMIDEMLESGELDATTTGEYRAKAPHILTLLQNEIIGIENRYRSFEEQVKPVKIESLEQTVQVDDIKANTLLTNGLASHLMLHENKALANFFQQRYEEMRKTYLKPTPSKITKKEDVYGANLCY